MATLNHFAMNTEKWFFANPEEQRRKERFKQQEQEDLKAHLEKSKQQQIQRRGRALSGTANDGGDFDPITGLSRGRQQNSVIPSVRVNGHDSTFNMQAFSKKENRGYPTGEDLKQRLPQPEGEEQVENDDRFFIRRLKAAFERETSFPGDPAAFDQYMAVSVPQTNPFSILLRPGQQITNQYAYLNRTPSAFSLPPIAVSEQINTRGPQISVMKSSDSNYKQSAGDERLIKKERDQDNAQQSIAGPELQAAAPSSGSKDKRFHRGIDSSLMPDWQREEVEKKQRKIADNQALLKAQMQEQESLKKERARQQKEEERREFERIDAERRQLNEKYELELAKERKTAAKKAVENDGAPAKAISKSEARENAQNAAAEKLIEAQREADELKRNKFRNKRAPGQDHDENFVANLPTRTFKINSIQELDSSAIVEKSSNDDSTVSEESGTLLPPLSSKTNQLLKQLESLKNDLEKERQQIQNDIQAQQESNAARNSAKTRAEYDNRQSSPIVKKAFVGFNINDNVKFHNAKLASTSHHFDVDSSLDAIWELNITDVRPTSMESQSTVSYEVAERLAEARRRRAA